MGPRFADHLLARKLDCRLNRALREAVRFNVDGVARYVGDDIRAQLETTKQYRLGVGQVPNAAPPFALMWFDWRGEDARWLSGWCGALMESHPCDDGGWMVEATSYVEGGNDPIAVVGLRFYVDPHGVIDSGSAQPIIVPVWETEKLATYPEPYRSELAQRVFGVEDGLEGGFVQAWLLLLPALLTIAFTHCKNVETVDDQRSAYLARTWFAKHKRHLLRYRVLEIDPMKEVLRREGGSEGSGGLRKALHICRGHFATYTPDRPLFGHFTGTVWKTQHIRGDRKRGIVLKDYKVKAVPDLLPANQQSETA